MKADIPDGAKLLYGLILSMYIKRNIPVRAGNEWLSDRLNVSIKTIKRHLGTLKHNKLIYVQLEEYSSRKTKRLITPLLHFRWTKMTP
jgi:predicted ArsR family transcriptional regulator